MFKTDDLIKIGLYNKNFKLHEDKELMERFKKHFNVTRIPLPLYRYRQHSKNITSNVKNDKFYKSKLKNEKKNIKLGSFKLTNNSGPYIIAEIGVNHECSIKLAKKMIDQASSGGAQAVKFQTYKAEKIAAKNLLSIGT